MANGALANMLGRGDLSPGYNAVVVSSDGTASPAVIGGTPMISGGFNNSFSGDVAVGQVSAGVLIVAILGLALFYTWTRGAQK